MLRRFVLSLIVFVAACASTSASSKGPQSATYVSDPSKAPENADVVVCENEMPTGSFIAETKCRRVVDKDADRRAAQQMMEEAPTHSVPPRSK